MNIITSKSRNSKLKNIFHFQEKKQSIILVFNWFMLYFSFGISRDKLEIPGTNPDPKIGRDPGISGSRDPGKQSLVWSEKPHKWINLLARATWNQRIRIVIASKRRLVTLQARVHSTNLTHYVALVIITFSFFLFHNSLLHS